MYNGFARSAGLNCRESLLYSNVGSFLWETGGETTDPSINDQIASGFGGSFFGEALFRMASLVLEGDGGKPGFWRELGATIVSPPTGINRLAFGGRFKPVFHSHDPATFWRLRLGASRNFDLTDNAGSSTISRDEAHVLCDRHRRRRPGGTETIGRLNTGFTVRIYGRHALGIQYILTTRTAQYPDGPDSYRKVGIVSLVYTLLGDTRFGAVEWRDPDRR